MQSPIRILSGDIGGTKTRLAIINAEGTRLHVEREQTYASREYAAFEELLGEFLQGSDIPARAAFGIAGPVQGRVVHTTNLPWRIDADALQNKFGCEHCTLLNDLEATALGLPALREKDLLTLHAGASNASGNAAIIAAGTGLGEAGLFWDGQRYQPFATEGGHASFSPSNDMEIALLQYLQRRHEHVSWERIVSGPGLINLHEFLCQCRGVPLPDWLQHEMQEGDAAAAIANAALTERDEVCVEALDWLVRLYGAEAGNLALKVMSRGGLFLGGGIAPKILSRLQKGTFVDNFFNKGRMRPLLEAMSVRVILNDRVALYGAALYVLKM
ncbi:MAG: glucokinase [Gallionella sp.]